MLDIQQEVPVVRVGRAYGPSSQCRPEPPRDLPKSDVSDSFDTFARFFPYLPGRWSCYIPPGYPCVPLDHAAEGQTPHPGNTSAQHGETTVRHRGIGAGCGETTVPWAQSFDLPWVADL